MTDPQKDEHIEELLSKLQGIFGKLSHSEEEEAKQKIEIPQAAPLDEEKTETPAEPAPGQVAPGDPYGQPLHPKGVGAPPASKVPPEVPKAASPTPINLYAEPGTPTPTPSSVPAEPPATPTPGEAGATPAAGTYESMVPTGDPEKLLIPTAVYFPLGKEAEAKSLAQKLEMMTPKFTKVAFRLRVIVFMSYDPKKEWKDALMAKAAEAQFQTVFVVVDRAMEETRKKTILSELEVKNVYFQDVPMASIEKKAFYTDILLGLVFFFDSHKPPAPPEAASA
jgi:hypothetical protein